MRFLLYLLAVPALAATTLADLPRAEICLNGPGTPSSTPLPARSPILLGSAAASLPKTTQYMDGGLRFDWDADNIAHLALLNVRP